VDEPRPDPPWADGCRGHNRESAAVDVAGGRQHDH
jgi:hypothetical protein